MKNERNDIRDAETKKKNRRRLAHSLLSLPCVSSPVARFAQRANFFIRFSVRHLLHAVFVFVLSFDFWSVAFFRRRALLVGAFFWAERQRSTTKR